MTVREALEHCLGELPAEIQGFIAERIRWEVRPAPTPADLELGAAPTDQGLFVGIPVRGDDEEEGGELYDEEDGNAHAEGAPEYYETADGGGIAEVDTGRPGGRIILFTENIKPLDGEHIAAVVMHELAHFFGETEEGVFEMGFA